MNYGRLLLAVWLVTGCATGQQTSGSAPADRNVITQQEIEAAQSLTAYDMIRALRPRWLSERGVTSLRTSNPIMVYVNENRVGTVDRLRDYAPRDLREARFLDATQATQRFGTGHRSGAIMLYLRSGDS
jgi:hypothetical protein